jgi:hypothetical protein
VHPDDLDTIQEDLAMMVIMAKGLQKKIQGRVSASKVSDLVNGIEVLKESIVVEAEKGSYL